MTGTSDRRLGLGAVVEAGAQAWRRRLVLRVSQSWTQLTTGPLGSLTRAIALSAAALLVALLVGWSLAGAEDVEGDATPETALTLESATPTSLTVTRDDVPNATLCSVRWRLTGQTAFSPSYAATGGRYQITGLLPGRNYRVRIEVSGGNGVVFRILGGTWRTPLTAPEDLTVTAASADSLSLSWTKPDGWNPAGYRLRWRKPSDAQYLGTVNLASSATSHTITGLTDQTQYVVNLLALNDLGSASSEARLNAYAVDPLTLSLTSSREVCTANTLTELTWEVTGGLKPHRLFIDGKKIDLDNVDTHTVNCGPLTIDPQTEEPLPNQTKTFSATAKDKHGVSASGHTSVGLLEPLRAPTDLVSIPDASHARIFWPGVSGAGSQFALGIDGPPVIYGAYAVRYRRVGPAQWRYATRLSTNSDGIDEWENPGEGLHELEAAAIRHPLEIETPQALIWSQRLSYTPPTEIRNATVSVTADSVTVQWQAQPGTGYGFVEIESENGSRRVEFQEPSEPGLHRHTFSHVEPGTSYEVTIYKASGNSKAGHARLSAQTLPPPAGYIPPPLGPQNLRASISQRGTLTCLTIEWDAPSAHADHQYLVTIVEQETLLLVDTAVISDGVTSYFTCGRDTHRNIESSRTYTVGVVHHGIRAGEADISISTVPMQEGQRDAATDYAVDPLALTLTSSREVCTANTLTELSWEITGGLKPHRLFIDGKKIDLDNVDTHTVNCGPLANDPATTESLLNQTKSFSATAKDVRGVSVNSYESVELVEPIPAPGTPGPVQPTNWGASVVVSRDSWAPNLFDEGRIVARHRLKGTEAWIYKQYDYAGRVGFGLGVGEYEFQLAYLRHPVEEETPEALRWTSALGVKRLLPAPNLEVVSTHDTVEVRFDDQLGDWRATIKLSGYNADGELVGSVQRDFLTLYDRPPPGERYTATFAHLPPSSRFTVNVWLGTADFGSTHASTEVRTSAAPEGWEPPARTPQNLQATATHDTITVRWDAPYQDPDIIYFLQVTESETGREIYAFFPGADQREWNIIGGHYERLKPSTTYRVTVIHRGIPFSGASVQVTTLPVPLGAIGSDGRGGNQGQSVLRNQELLWPVRVNTDYDVTDDPFYWRTYGRFHAGLDLGSGEEGPTQPFPPSAREQRLQGGPVFAVDSGTLLIFNHKLDSQWIWRQEG